MSGITVRNFAFVLYIAFYVILLFYTPPLVTHSLWQIRGPVDSASFAIVVVNIVFLLVIFDEGAGKVFFLLADTRLM